MEAQAQALSSTSEIYDTSPRTDQRCRRPCGRRRWSPIRDGTRAPGSPRRSLPLSTAARAPAARLPNQRGAASAACVPPRAFRPEPTIRRTPCSEGARRRPLGRLDGDHVAQNMQYASTMNGSARSIQAPGPRWFSTAATSFASGSVALTDRSIGVVIK